MRRWIVVLAIVAALLTTGFMVQQQQRQEWQYQFVELNPVSTVERVCCFVTVNGQRFDYEGTLYGFYNAMGSDGWEYDGQIDDNLIFKRAA